MGKATDAQLTEEAAAWLVRLDGGTADREAFEAWRAADARRAVAFAEVAYAWRELDGLRPMRSGIGQAPSKISRRHAIRFAAAAGVVALVGVAGFPILNDASATTGTGERRSLALPDGSRVELNTRTHVRWNRLSKERTLWLDEGEIALHVAADAAPFQLVASQTVLLEHGTFNARREANVMTLLPIEGRAVANGQIIEVGRIASIVNRQPIIVPVDAATRERALDWQRGDLVFDGETLAAAVAEYNRYLKRPIILADPGLSRRRIGGRFHSSDPAPFLHAVVDGFGAQLSDDGTGPIIVSAAEKIAPPR